MADAGLASLAQSPAIIAPSSLLLRDLSSDRLDRVDPYLDDPDPTAGLRMSMPA